jgi:hypothetical protein
MVINNAENLHPLLKRGQDKYGGGESNYSFIKRLLTEVNGSERIES